MPDEILQTHKLLPRCEEELAKRFTVHRLHEAADKDTMIAELAPRVRAIAGGNVDAALMDRLPKLEIIANFGVGYDSIDTAAAKARNIRVTNTPNVLNDAVAELTLGMMIGLARRIPHTIVPALLVLAGGYTLRWLMVNAGQMSEIVQTAAR